MPNNCNFSNVTTVLKMYEQYAPYIVFPQSGINGDMIEGQAKIVLTKKTYPAKNILSGNCWKFRKTSPKERAMLGGCKGVWEKVKIFDPVANVVPVNWYDAKERKIVNPCYADSLEGSHYVMPKGKGRYITTMTVQVQPGVFTALKVNAI